MSENRKYYSFNVDSIQPNMPFFLEKTGKKWISYGADNLYPQFVAGLYNTSAMNRTCITSKADAVFGKGLMCVDETKDYILARANSKESWNDVFEKCVIDYITFGGFALNVIWSNDGETIAEIYHLDFSRVRSGIVNPVLDEVDYYFYADDWKQYRRFPPKQYRAFDPDCALEEPSQVLYFFDYGPNQLYYPIPSYGGSINDIQIDVEVSKFHINNLANGLAPSLFISLNNGIPDDNTRQEIYDEITMAFRGTENAGKAFISFSDSKDHAPEVHPIKSENSDYYISLENRITSRILSGHRITSPLLLGLYQATGSAGFNSKADEIETAYEHFISTTIKPIQKSMLKVFNKMIQLYGYDKLELQIIPNKIFDASSTSTAIE